MQSQPETSVRDGVATVLRSSLLRPSLTRRVVNGRVDFIAMDLRFAIPIRHVKLHVAIPGGPSDLDLYLYLYLMSSDEHEHEHEHEYEHEYEHEHEHEHEHE